MIDKIIFKQFSRGFALFACVLFVLTPFLRHRTLATDSIVLAIITGASLVSCIFFATVSYTFSMMSGDA